MRQPLRRLPPLVTIAALVCVFVLWLCGKAFVANVITLGVAFVLALFFAFRQRRRLALAALCAGPLFGATVGVAAMFDPVYVLPSDRLHVLLGVTIVGVIAGTATAWAVLIGTRLRESE